MSNEIKEIVIKANNLEKFISTLPTNGPFGEELEANAEKSVIVSRNVTSAELSPRAELHENYTDIFLVKEGNEELFIGGKITDKKLTAPGEWRGEVLENARKYTVGSGDVVIIPKNVAHRHGVGTIKMIVIKIG